MQAGLIASMETQPNANAQNDVPMPEELPDFDNLGPDVANPQQAADVSSSSSEEVNPLFRPNIRTELMFIGPLTNEKSEPVDTGGAPTSD